MEGGCGVDGCVAPRAGAWIETPDRAMKPSGTISPERSASIPTHPEKVAGIGSEHRPNSPRNGGRIASEYAKIISERCEFLYEEPGKGTAFLLLAFKRYQDHRKYLDMERDFAAAYVKRIAS